MVPARRRAPVPARRRAPGLPALALALAVVTAAGGAGCRDPGGGAPAGAGGDGPAAGRVGGAGGGAGSAVVVRVVDGDTVRVVTAGREESVRLIGIDTPETHGAGGLRECFGREATRRIEGLLPEGTAVRLVRDVEARDRYGRLLAYLYRHDDSLFVNLAMAREGFAAALTIPPNVAHAPEFVDAAAEARRRSLGLWGRCGDADQPL